jgi:hypothetical protein
MSCDIEPVLPEGPVYRMARGPDPWVWADWVYAGPDGSFGGRFDDPHGEYRVLYAASTRLGAFMETLAGFRTHPAVRQSLPDGDAAAPDSVPREWLELRRIGEARLPELPFADIGHSRSLAFLRERLMDAIVEHELEDLDAAAIRLSAPRRFTQLVGRLAFDCTDADGEPQFAGLRYGSRLGDELHDWALFERPGSALTASQHEPVDEDDPDLKLALERLGLRLV